MIILDTTTKTVKVIMSGAAATTNPDFTAAWADDTGTTLTEGATDGALNGASDVTVVAAPASSTRRVIKTITIENRDTAPVTVTVKYDNNATQRNIAKVTLAVGDTWTTDGTYDTNGNLKQIMGAVSLTTGVTGVLPIANGGTNASTSSITSFNNITGFTASGSTGTTSTNLVFSTSPTFITPTLGAATATSVNKVAITAPASSATLAIADGKTFTVSNSLTLAGTDTTTMTFPSTSATVAGLTITQTLTNKRITRRVVTTTQSATPTVNTDNTDVSSITALGQAITSMTTNLSGTPAAGDLLMFQITDDGTARAITWGSSFEATTISLPTTTVISTMLRVGFQWNTVASKWDCIAVA